MADSGHFRRTRTTGNAAVGAALKSVRLKAGFKSGRAASLHFGWVEATYRAHESGRRSLSQKDLERYARAFDVENRTLLYPQLGDSKHLYFLEKELAERDQANRLATGRRLMLARMLRGFTSASDACKRFGFSRSTYGGHENGVNAISSEMAEVYGAAFAISPAWLRHALKPSGFGQKFDERQDTDSFPQGTTVSLSRDMVERYRPLVEVRRLPAKGRIARLLKHFRRESSSTKPFSYRRQEVIREIPIAAVTEFLSGGLPNTGDIEGWTLPRAVVSKVIGADPRNVVVFPLDRSLMHFKAGDRLFVDISQRDTSVGGLFARSAGSDGLELRRFTSGKNFADISLLGRVIAIFRLGFHL